MPAAKPARGTVWKLLALTLLAGLLSLAPGCGAKGEPTGHEEQARQEEMVEVPPEYEGVYADFASKLAEIDAHLDKSWDSEKHGTIFSVELITANGNHSE